MWFNQDYPWKKIVGKELPAATISWTITCLGRRGADTKLNCRG